MLGILDKTTDVIGTAFLKYKVKDDDNWEI